MGCENGLLFRRKLDQMVYELAGSVIFMISQIVTKYYRYMGNVYGIFIIKRTKLTRI